MFTLRSFNSTELSVKLQRDYLEHVNILIDINLLTVSVCTFIVLVLSVLSNKVTICNSPALFVGGGRKVENMNTDSKQSTGSNQAPWSYDASMLHAAPLC